MFGRLKDYRNSIQHFSRVPESGNQRIKLIAACSFLITGFSIVLSGDINHENPFWYNVDSDGHKIFWGIKDCFNKYCKDKEIKDDSGTTLSFDNL